MSLSKKNMLSKWQDTVLKSWWILVGLVININCSMKNIFLNPEFVHIIETPESLLSRQRRIVRSLTPIRLAISIRFKNRKHTIVPQLYAGIYLSYNSNKGNATALYVSSF